MQVSYSWRRHGGNSCGDNARLIALGRNTPKVITKPRKQPLADTIEFLKRWNLI